MKVIDAIRHRRSVRQYDGRPLEPEVYERLKAALRYAPSACNLQPWRFILVEDPARRQLVAQACRGQIWMAQAPLIVVACGFPDQAYQKMGGYASSIDIDLAIALDHLSLAAVAEGLGTCWIGAFDERQVKILLAIPESIRVVALMPVGYPAAAELNRPLDEGKRKSPDEIFTIDTF
ncbi:MAG: nitroreductase family protein [Sedimentisphaerales bacterium]|nr:nitroreductase family protein [Sedimentisphaerales bacterium]